MQRFSLINNRMPTFPAPAKLNLFLHVVGRRSDGYHLLQTVFRFLEYSDQITFEIREDGIVKLQTPLAGVPEEKDLCVRAAKLLQQVTGSKQGVDIYLEKKIPMGGGLGGGSSDAATTLLALNRLWALHLSQKQLLELGLQLGADVPVFVFGQNAFAEGVGATFCVGFAPSLVCGARSVCANLYRRNFFQ